MNTDNDGTTNNMDNDDDGDGIPTIQEEKVRPWPATSSAKRGRNFHAAPFDSDQDGIPNYLDADDDSDGVLTKNELGDADQDGLADAIESNIRDLDNDGKKDNRDTDDDGDGILSKLDTNPSLVSGRFPRHLKN